MDFFSIRYGFPHDKIVEVIKSIEIASLSTDNSTMQILFPRQTLLFRDVPETVTADECRNIFTQELQKEIVSITKDKNQIWYIKFSSEQNAMMALDESQNNKLLGSEPLRSRLKNEIPVLPQLPKENLMSYYYIPPTYDYSYIPPSYTTEEEKSGIKNSYNKDSRRGGRDGKSYKRGGYTQSGNKYNGYNKFKKDQKPDYYNKKRGMNISEKIAVNT